MGGNKKGYIMKKYECDFVVKIRKNKGKVSYDVYMRIGREMEIRAEGITAEELMEFFVTESEDIIEE